MSFGRLSTATLLLILAVLVQITACPPVAIARFVGDPARNHTPSRATELACLTPGSSQRTCDGRVLGDIAVARRSEGLAPMSLPGDFAALAAPLQLLALVDLERVDHGLPPAIGLTRRLDARAQEGAKVEQDPFGPDGYSWGSNWAAGASSTVFDDFSWMYDDGAGSGNLDCAAPGDPGCWGHRENILGSYRAPIAMGAGSHGTSLTELFVGDYLPAMEGSSDPVLAPSWKQIAQTLPVGVSTDKLHLAPHASGARLTVWASGEPMLITATIAGGASTWSVSRKSCQLAAGSSCNLRIGAAQGRRHRGSLELTGPNGARTVALS